jgi:endo-1,4-beta-D-glucanase Y
MGSAVFGARIGSAAFALGLGLAIASSPGIAVADDADTSTSDQSTGDTLSRSTDASSAVAAGRAASVRSPQLSPHGRTPDGFGRSRDTRSAKPIVANHDNDFGSFNPAGPVGPTAARPEAFDPPTNVAGAAAIKIADNNMSEPAVRLLNSTRSAGTETPPALEAPLAVATQSPTAGLLSGLRSLFGIGPTGSGNGLPATPMEFVTAAVSLIGREVNRLFATAASSDIATMPETATTANSAAAVWRWQSLASAAKLPSISIANASKSEGNTGTSSLGFTVTLSKSTSTPVTVAYATSNGTASAGQDYTTASGTITFAAGQTSQTVNVGIIGDTAVESDETFTMTLSAPSGATISRATATGTIRNDDVALPTLSIADASKSEGNSGTSSLGFTVTLSKASTTAVTVNYATSNGSATAGSDYVANSGTVTFAAGQTSKTINVTLRGDATVESDETFAVTLLAPSGATISRATATGTIRNDDAAALPTISIADANKSEGNSGTSNLAFLVTLSKASTTSVTVNYATADGSATAGADYAATSGTVTFAAGETSKTVNVAVSGDAAVEPDETMAVTLSGANGATISRGVATGTIVNDDTTSGGTTGQPAVPFGSHLRPYASGTILPTGTQATLDAAVVALYTKWKSSFLVSAGDYGLAVKASADYPYVSEGQGYGMELTVLMAGADPSAQTAFDGILKYVLAHPSSINPDLHASEQNSSFASVNGKDSATDGDLSIAYALLLADKQWGSSGTYNYKQLAVKRINAIKASEMNPTTFLPTLGDWNSPGDSLYNSTRPSDFMIDHFRAFKVATNDTFWDSAVTATQNLLTQQQTTYAPATGLIPDFVVNTNTTPKPAPANFLESSTDGQYSYNAVRVPWHIGTDAVVFGDATSKAQARKITAWFRAKTSDDPTKIVSGYKLDGTPTVNYLDPEFVALLGPAAMSDVANQAWLDKIWAYTVSQSKTSAANSYYSASLMLQAMIVMSGNYWTP